MDAATVTKMVEEFQLSDCVNRISVSPTMLVLHAAEQLKSKGVDVADFGAGEPDFPTPEHIKRAAVKALEENRTKYTPTPGIAPLRQAICDWHAAQLGSSYQPAECIVSVGGKQAQAIFNAVCSLVNPGDEVVIPAPYWVSYPDIVKYAGGNPVILETRAADNFILRAADLEKLLTPRTRMVIAAQGRVAALGRMLFAFHLWRRQAVFRRQPAQVEARAHRHRVVLENLRDDRLARGLRARASAPHRRDDQAAEPVHLERYFDCAVRRARSDARSHGLGPGDARRIRPPPRAHPRRPAPQGAFYVFPNISAHFGPGMPDDTAAAKQLLDREHVAVVPGEAFGARGHLRISYATSMDRIEEGLRRLGRFFGRAT
jgi:aspartate aminotransferase